MVGAALASLPARPHLEHENRLRLTGAATLVAGIDEAGRGPLAGPVVAAAVILPEGFTHRHLNDSKRLSAGQRDRIYGELTNEPAVIWAAAVVDSAEVDRLNILRATHEAMRRAFRALSRRPDHALIDGLPVHPFPVAHTALVGGDAISLSIAAASVIAKVTRDRLMEELDRSYPGYGFSQHKGYATSRHLAMLAQHGPCPIHRFSFVRWRSRVFPPPPANPAHKLGWRGEKLAARFLKRHGYKVLYRRFRARGGGEVDLVCRHGETLVFVEVKTRSGVAYGRPGEAVTLEKQKLIARGASAWLRMLPEMEIVYRFDIVEVVIDENRQVRCEIIADAFTPSDYELR